MKPASIPLSGATVLITGAGRGIGRATAELFARRHAKVAVADLDLAAAERAAAEIGRAAVPFSVDVTDRDRFAALVDEVRAALGPIDILVNNAGIMPSGPFLQTTEATTAAQLAVNLGGPIHGMQIVLPEMLARGRGHVVNVASMAGKTPLPGLAVYCATKYAVVGLTAAVRRELRGTGVTATAVCPGPVDTALAAGFPLLLARFTKIRPETVAAAIVGSVRERPAEVVVPDWMRAAGWLNALADRLPDPLTAPLLRLAGGELAMGDPADPRRAAYLDRLRRDNGASGGVRAQAGAPA